MTGTRTFKAGVMNSIAFLPSAPEHWSYSSLKSVERCPRSYVLARSKFPDLWKHTGYPEVPTIAALFGDIVHDSLQAIVQALVNSGCASVKSAEAVAVLKQLGGYSAVVREMMMNRLRRLDDNPRLTKPTRERLTDQLEQRIPEAREEVQHYLIRLELTPREAEVTHAEGAGVSAHRARGIGTHCEATLRADDLRIWGRVDLLNVGPERVDLTDYKTGAEDESHFDQLRFYALLWDQDRVSNDRCTPLGRLTVSYPNNEQTIPAPDNAELQRLAIEIEARVDAADNAIHADDPAAVPGDHCGYCSVKSLCADYWTGTPDPQELVSGSWFDFEGVVDERNGIKSWWLREVQPRGRRLLLRTSTVHPSIELGQHLRLLGLRRDEDPDTDAAVAVLTGSAEIFLLEGRDR